MSAADERPLLLNERAMRAEFGALMNLRSAKLELCTTDAIERVSDSAYCAESSRPVASAGRAGRFRSRF